MTFWLPRAWWVGSALLAAAHSAAADGFRVQLTEWSLRPVDLPSYSLVCSGYDIGVCHNLSDLYRADRRHRIRATALVHFSPHAGLKVTVQEGAEAPKVSADHSLRLGFLAGRSLAQGRSIAFEVYNTFGGAVRHRPCIDQYQREYFCGSLTAWSDYQDKVVRPSDYGVRMHWRF